MIRDNYGNPVPRSEWDTSDYERAADRYEQRIADLEAQVGRLQSAFRGVVAAYDATVKAEYSFTHGLDELADTHGLRPGDLDPVDGGDA